MNPKLALVGVALVLPHLSPQKPPTSSSEPHKAIVAATANTPKQLTENDYVQPLKNWLKKQGSPLSGQDFFDVGVQNHIDPDLLIAITKAETNLGRVVQRGSTCNVGSVGSYDSTSTTFGCSSYRHGLEQIAETINNRALGDHIRVGDLSRKSNKNPNSSIYASSTDNWENNVLATLSELKGHPVDNQYQFRR